MGLLQPAGSAPCFCRHFPSPTDVQNPNLRSALGFCGNSFYLFIYFLKMCLCEEGETQGHPLLFFFKTLHQLAPAWAGRAAEPQQLTDLFPRLSPPQRCPWHHRRKSPSGAFP